MLNINLDTFTALLVSCGPILLNLLSCILTIIKVIRVAKVNIEVIQKYINDDKAITNALLQQLTTALERNNTLATANLELKQQLQILTTTVNNIKTEVDKHAHAH